MKSARLLLICIFLLGLYLRFYRLTDVPVSPFWDEVSHAYNAYSLLNTGKDEYGTPFPLIIRSFDDYKRAGHTYLTILPVLFWGLNEFSARFVSAFLGSLTVVIVYFLAKALAYELNVKRARSFCLLVTLLLAISPWHLQFSRAGFEANTSLFFNIFGVWLFIKSIRNPRYLIPAVFLFGLSFYIYYNAYLFVPLFVLGGIYIFRKEFRKINRSLLLLSVFIFLLTVFPILPALFSKEAQTRQNQVNIFANSETETFQAAQKIVASGGSTWAKIIYNRRLVYAKIFFANYFSHFAPGFLFQRGDGNGRHVIFGRGYLYWWEMPFLLIGLGVLLLKRTRHAKLLFWWMLIAPLPGALAVPSPHALRSLYLLPLPQIMTSLGLIYLVNIFKSRLSRHTAVVICALLIGLYAGDYLRQYYGVSARIYSSYWGDGYKELALYIAAHEKRYDKVVVTGHYWKPYVYFLFYKKYDPFLYQSAFGNSGQFNNYIFGGTGWGKGEVELDKITDLRDFAQAKNILVALSPGEATLAHKRQMRLLTEIKNKNGETVFIVAEINADSIKNPMSKDETLGI